MTASSTALRTFYHFPSRIIYGTKPRESIAAAGPAERLVLLLLNQRISTSDPLFTPLWRRAHLRICADGAANRLYSAFHQASPLVVPNRPTDQRPQRTPAKSTTLRAMLTVAATSSHTDHYIPEAICGDLDSVLPDVAHYFSHHQAFVHYVDDQDTTDFMKNLLWLDDLERRHGDATDPAKSTVIAYGGLGGRLDQSMSSLYVLYNYGAQRPIYLLSEESIALLLLPGVNHVECDWFDQSPACGILPIGVTSATVTTQGLRWNLDNAQTSFSGLLSTSNIVDSPVVVVTTTDPLIWTVEVRK
ncbi:cAMP-dependent protein kinase subunit [Dimargaris xerosporica]|nr:cAMP-dependent protein kinase subunit [Dimargaris xerosporica]